MRFRRKLGRKLQEGIKGGGVFADTGNAIHIEFAKSRTSLLSTLLMLYNCTPFILPYFNQLNIVLLF